jgi:hypothetical protein
MIVEKRVAKTEAVGLNASIKPAAPLLACVIRRVFFYLDEAMIVPKGAVV